MLSGESVITTAAGTGQPYQFHNGVKGPQARMGYANDVAAAPDGSVYIAEITSSDTGLISRLRPDGVLETVAGGGFATSEGVPALSARLRGLRGIALGPDGSVYLTEPNAAPVRRIDPQGNIRTVAGGGQQPFVEGSVATSVELGVTDEVAVAPDGGLYVATGHFVRHVGTDGLITTRPRRHSPRRGRGRRPATAASLGYVNGLAVSRQGELYIAGNGRVRRVNLGGQSSSAAGGGDPANGAGNGGPGTAAALGALYGMDFALDGSLYFTERNGGGNLVRRLASDGTITTAAGRPPANCCGNGPLGDHGPPGQAGLGEIVGVGRARRQLLPRDPRRRELQRPRPARLAPAAARPGRQRPDPLAGRQAGLRVREGRHLRTLDGLTGAPLFRFSYDGAGGSSRSPTPTTTRRPSNAMAPANGRRSWPRAASAPNWRSTPTAGSTASPRRRTKSRRCSTRPRG